MKKLLFPILFLLPILTFSQVTTAPTLPTANEVITIMFDATGTPLEDYTGDVYTHTGVTTNGNRWQNVIGDWNNNSAQPQLTRDNSNPNLYTLLITPDVYTYYNVPTSAIISEFNFVFRASTGSPQSDDIFVPIYQAGLNVTFTSPVDQSTYDLNDVITITAESSISSNLELFVNDVSQQTTTGYATADFNTWPFVAKAVLLLLMFVGGCAGSTGGGIKVIRIWIALKVMFSELERSFRPNVVRPLKVGKSAIDPELKLATIAYVLGVLILFAVGTGSLMVFESGNPECSITTAATASIATICTVGPGLAKVGAIENYGWFSDASKLLLCVLMAIGRLEVFAVLVLITPRFWRST